MTSTPVFFLEGEVIVAKVFFASQQQPDQVARPVIASKVHDRDGDHSEDRCCLHFLVDETIGPWSLPTAEAQQT